jgi:cytochrome c oxidase subunit I
MIWVVLMIYNMAAWKRDNPGRPVPLAMFAITATALLWAWAASGVIVELLGIILPRALGLTTQINASLGRTLFSVTLHSIVYFWLMPAYIAFYTLVPQAAGGRLYSAPCSGSASRWCMPTGSEKTRNIMKVSRPPRMGRPRLVAVTA